MRLKAGLKLDLRSEEVYKQPGMIARFFGAQPKATGKERVFGSTLSVLDHFASAYKAMNIKNVAMA